MALAQLEAPVEGARRVGREVEGGAEGRGEALVEPLLVEVEGGFEGGRGAGEERRAREDEACFDAVAGGGGVGGG